MADSQASKQQASSGVPAWLLIVIGILALAGIGILALLFFRASSDGSGSTQPGLLPTQAAIALVPSLTPTDFGGPDGPTDTPTWTPRPSGTPYITPTFVNTAVAPEVNTRAAGDISIDYQQRQIIIVGGSGQPVTVPTVTPAIPRSTQTSVAATATQAITQTKVAATATQFAATATQGAATATSAAITATPLPGIWRGDYYNNKDLQDPIVMVRNDPVQTVNNLFLLYNWGSGSPDSSKVNSDNFSVRWRLNADFLSADYLFYAFSDDGVRVFVDDGTVIDNWTNATNRVLYGTRNMSNGQHRMRVEYYESLGDARIAVGWQQAVENAWVGEYYNNRDLGEPPLYIRQDNSINFDWQGSSPNALPNDNFSIRWFRNYNFGNAGTFRITVHVDDGVRVRVGNDLIINEWHTVQGPQTYTVDRQYSGTEKITVEYFEGNGNAQIQLNIGRVNQPTPTPIPPTATVTATSTMTPTITPTFTATPTETPTPIATP